MHGFGIPLSMLVTCREGVIAIYTAFCEGLQLEAYVSKKPTLNVEEGKHAHSP